MGVNNSEDFKKSLINVFGRYGEVIIDESRGYKKPYLAPKMFSEYWSDNDSNVFQYSAAILNDDFTSRELDEYLCYCSFNKKSPFELQMFLCLLMAAKKMKIKSYFIPPDALIPVDERDFIDLKCKDNEYYLSIQPEFPAGNYLVDFHLSLLFTDVMIINGKKITNTQNSPLFLECDGRTCHRENSENYKKDYLKNYALNSLYSANIYRVDSEDFWIDPMPHALRVLARMTGNIQEKIHLSTIAMNKLIMSQTKSDTEI